MHSLCSTVWDKHCSSYWLNISQANSSCVCDQILQKGRVVSAPLVLTRWETFCPVSTKAVPQQAKELKPPCVQHGCCALHMVAAVSTERVGQGKWVVPFPCRLMQQLPSLCPLLLKKIIPCRGIHPPPSALSADAEPHFLCNAHAVWHQTLIFSKSQWIECA